MTSQVVIGDCLETMKQIPDQSVDMILADLPYGVTQNDWDSVIDLEKLWTQYRRIAKKNAAIVLTSQGLFSARLMTAASDLFKYSWIWKKNKSTGFLNAKKQPLRAHEDVLVFYKSPPTYNPQKTTGHKPVNSFTKHTSDGSNYGATQVGLSGGGQTDRYPTTVIEISVVNNDSEEKCHPTQKPVVLGEYFIKTYSNEGDLIVDNACGSGSFLVAAKNLNRRYWGCDISSEYVEIARSRLA